MIVSTCNRVEFYVAAEEPAAGFAAVHDFVAAHADAPEGDAFFRHPLAPSVRHLFRVVSGLDSMVLGETEILGQVKKAYAAAAGGGATARHLNKLFQRAFNVAKEVRTKTNITRGSVSVGSVAVDLAEKIFGKLAACKVMILGAGETSETDRRRAPGARREIDLRGQSQLRPRRRAGARRWAASAIHFDEWAARVSRRGHPHRLDRRAAPRAHRRAARADHAHAARTARSSASTSPCRATSSRRSTSSTASTFTTSTRCSASPTTPWPSAARSWCSARK